MYIYIYIHTHIRYILTLMKARRARIAMRAPTSGTKLKKKDLADTLYLSGAHAKRRVLHARAPL